MPLTGYTIPRSPEGRSSLVPYPPWHYVGDFLVIEFWADQEKAVSCLPAGMDPHPDPGRCAFVFADWQSCSAAAAELRDPSRSQYKEAFLVVNAHLGHAPWHYAGSARVLLDLIAAEAPDPATPVFLLGDFNAVTGSGVMRRLRQALRDATAEASRLEGPYETFQWNASTRMRRLRLDHVLVRGSARALTSSVLTPRDPARGLPPSDHDPLVVDFEV